MCTTSFVMDDYRDRWTPLVQQVPQYVPVVVPIIQPAEVEEFRRLLERARQHDRETNQPGCEMESKKAALKALAEKLGVDISFVDAAT